jgi:UDP-glucuronate 4-epimerase
VSGADRVLVTGAAGFIGAAVAQRLLERGAAVVGLDNLNDYYDPRLKQARLGRLQAHARFGFEHIDLADRAAVAALFARQRFCAIVHLAAQAGVRQSLSQPLAYADSNLTGMLTVLEGARAQQVGHLVYASSSSVYGAHAGLPLAESAPAERPISLYAATKRAAELMAHVYALQFGVPSTGLRLFTVYGPWGRPDMAAMKFIRAMVAGQPIEVYHHGRMQRDFSFIDDVVEGVLRVLDRPPAPDADGVRHRLYNLGSGRAEPLLRFIDVLAAALGRQPELRLLPPQRAGVGAGGGDIARLRRDFGWAPATPIDIGLPRLVAWYRAHYGV